MARRNKNQAKRNGGIPGWLWLLVGLMLGTGAAVFYAWQGGITPNQMPQPDPAAKAPQELPEREALAQDPEQNKPRYDFYTVLPEKEVIIPDSELSERARADAEKPAVKTPAGQTKPASETPYLLQAGAFKSVGDAEALKAQIALTGQMARVESAVINGATYYRVRLGPYANAAALDSAKRALASNGIEALAIRVK